MSVDWKGAAITARIRSATMRGVMRGTESVVEEATSLILDGEKTGRVSRTRGVEHQASSPGEAPASDTGRLLQSGRTEFDVTEISGTAQWSTAYAGYLEHGTENMEPRPFARPALANRKNEIIADIADEIRNTLK